MVNLNRVPISIPERNNSSAGLSMASIQIKMIVVQQISIVVIKIILFFLLTLRLY